MRGRKKALDPSKVLKVKIPGSVLDAFEDFTFDPIANRIPYSARADIVTKLLQDHMRGQDGRKYHRLVSNLSTALSNADRVKIQTAMDSLLQFNSEVQSTTEKFDREDTHLDLSTPLG